MHLLLCLLVFGYSVLGIQLISSSRSLGNGLANDCMYRMYGVVPLHYDRASISIDADLVTHMFEPTHAHVRRHFVARV